MPHAILYHGFGIRGYRHLKTQFKEGCIYFYLVRKKKRCSFCHSFKVTQKGFKERTLRTLPIGSKKVFIVVKVRCFFCEQCGRRRFEDLPDSREEEALYEGSGAICEGAVYGDDPP